MQGLLWIFSLFRNKLNKFINTGVRMLGFISSFDTAIIKVLIFFCFVCAFVCVCMCVHACVCVF